MAMDFTADIWNACLYRPTFATWLSQTRFHTHSHRRRPDATITTYGKMYMNLFLHCFIQYVSDHCLKSVSWNYLYYMQPLKLTLTWRRIKTEDSDEPQKTNNRHNPKSGSSRLVRTKKTPKKPGCNYTVSTHSGSEYSQGSCQRWTKDGDMRMIHFMS